MGFRSFAIALIVLFPALLYGAGYLALGKPTHRLVGCCFLVKVRVYPCRSLAQAYSPAAMLETQLTGAEVVTDAEK